MQIYDVIVQTRLNSGLGNPWKNTFQMRRETAWGTADDAEGTAFTIAGAFSTALLATAEVVQVTFSPWVILEGVTSMEGTPPRGTPLIIPLTGDYVGSNSSSDEREGLDRTVIVEKRRSAGEPGRLELRHHLTDEMVAYISGSVPSWTGVVGTTQRSAITAAFSLLITTLQGDNTPMIMARYDELPSTYDIGTGPRGGKKLVRKRFYNPSSVTFEEVTGVGAVFIGSRDVGEGL